MAQDLGRIERPSIEQYRGKRKLLLLPLVYAPSNPAPEGLALLQRYWEQLEFQVASLEARLGGLRHIYHESLAQGGQEGLKHLETVDQRSFRFVQAKFQAGATLEATDDEGLLLENLDLQRCLMMPLASASVARRLYEWFSESNRSRYEHIASRIDVTLQVNETGLLLISERHQVQFPEDIEVFYVAPPALEDFRRWLQDWLAEQQKRSAGGPELIEETRPSEARGEPSTSSG